MRYSKALLAKLRALAIFALTSVTFTGVQAQTPEDPDTAAWKRARQENSVEAYQRYLELYPLGAHSAEAFQALVELLATGDLEPPGDAAVPGIDMY